MAKTRFHCKDLKKTPLRHSYTFTVWLMMLQCLFNDMPFSARVVYPYIKTTSSPFVLAAFRAFLKKIILLYNFNVYILKINFKK